MTTNKLSLDINPRPKDNVFTEYWIVLGNRLKESNKVTDENILNLKILCDLHSRYEELRDIIRLIGYSSSNGGGRNGNIDRANPEVGQLNKTVDQIRQYSKAIFGEVLYSSTEEENEFD